jgi:demethylmenaquinone methyltransferase/2-methoxy-6-polyprenyl-1,4-benzoquinol methylase
MLPAMATTSEKPPASADATTHFGFRSVPEADKAPLVRGIFERVAERYDLMNDLMSAGIHRLWKAALIADIDPRPGEILVDVAGGTGDIATRFLAAAGGTDRGAHAVICDINPAMVAVGRDRALDGGHIAGLSWVVGDAERLPVASASVDVYTIAFGLRNVTRIDAALAEARRVLKPGGRFFCLEFSRVTTPGLAQLYDFYSFNVLPALGETVTGDRGAYQYLVESIRRFPPQEELVKRMAAAGLGRPRYRNLSGGIAAIHAAWRL